MPSEVLRVRNKATGIEGVIAWDTETEVGIDCSGINWSGTREQFERLWERAALEAAGACGE